MGGDKRKIMDRPFKLKYGTVSQVLLQLVVAAVESKGLKGFLSPIDNTVDGVEGIVLNCGCKIDKGN